MLAVCHTISALQRVIEVLTSQDVDWVVVGKGSNLLVADEGFDGCVIVLGRDFSHVEASSEAATVCAGAAVPLSKVVQTAAKASLTGLEFACGIPGHTRRAPYPWTRARGASGSATGSRASSCCARARASCAPGSEVEWGYRWCGLGPSDIVLEATLALAHGERAAIDAQMEALFSRRRSTQPMGKPSCGSVFRNPAGARGRRVSWRTAGSRAYAVGGAQVSEVHAQLHREQRQRHGGRRDRRDADHA